MSRGQRKSASRGIRLHKMGITESFFHAQSTTDFNPSTYRAFQRSDMPIHREICTTQKQTNLINSLLQDIVIINEHDSTKLEEWLIDLETGANLTNES